MWIHYIKDCIDCVKKEGGEGIYYPPMCPQCPLWFNKFNMPAADKIQAKSLYIFNKPQRTLRTQRGKGPVEK